MDMQSAAPATMCFTKATLAAGTTTTLSTTGTTTYSVKGKFYTLSAWTNQATPTTDAATGNAFIGVLKNQGSIFLVGVDKSQAMKVIQGTIVPLDTVSVPGNFINAPNFGALGFSGSGSTDNDFCPIGYIVIQAGSTANNTTGWIFGTNNMSSVTGITYTFQDVCTIPDRPVVS